MNFVQPDVWVDDAKDQPSTSQQAAARDEFARPTKNRRQLGLQSKVSSLTGGGQQ